jgi:hypothetical protein
MFERVKTNIKNSVSPVGDAVWFGSPPCDTKNNCRCGLLATMGKKCSSIRLPIRHILGPDDGASRFARNFDT